MSPPDVLDRYCVRSSVRCSIHCCRSVAASAVSQRLCHVVDWALNQRCRSLIREVLCSHPWLLCRTRLKHRTTPSPSIQSIQSIQSHAQTIDDQLIAPSRLLIVLRYPELPWGAPPDWEVAFPLLSCCAIPVHSAALRRKTLLPGPSHAGEHHPTGVGHSCELRDRPTRVRCDAQH